MKKDKNMVKIMALALAAVYGVADARAQSYVDYTIGNGGLEQFNLNIDGHELDNALAGGIEITKSSGGAGLPNTYNTICTDLQGTLFLGTTYGYNTPILFNGQSGLNPDWGVGNQGSPRGNPANAGNAAVAIQNAAYLYYLHKGVLQGASPNATDEAALQLAVWEALYDSSAGGGLLSVTGPGRFHVTNADGNQAAVNEANTWLSDPKLYNAHSFQGYLLFPNPTDPINNNNEPAQELLIGVGDFTPAPEPSTMLTGALMLIPLGMSTARLLRRTKAA